MGEGRIERNKEIKKKVREKIKKNKAGKQKHRKT
jgi:hypothetical protein